MTAAYAQLRAKYSELSRKLAAASAERLEEPRVKHADSENIREVNADLDTSVARIEHKEEALEEAEAKIRTKQARLDETAANFDERIERRHAKLFGLYTDAIHRYFQDCPKPTWTVYRGEPSAVVLASYGLTYPEGVDFDHVPRRDDSSEP